MASFNNTPAANPQVAAVATANPVATSATSTSATSWSRQPLEDTTYIRVRLNVSRKAPKESGSSLVENVRTVHNGLVKRFSEAGVTFIQFSLVSDKAGAVKTDLVSTGQLSEIEKYIISQGGTVATPVIPTGDIDAQNLEVALKEQFSEGLKALSFQAILGEEEAFDDLEGAFHVEYLLHLDSVNKTENEGYGTIQDGNPIWRLVPGSVGQGILSDEEVKLIGRSSPYEALASKFPTVDDEVKTLIIKLMEKGGRSLHAQLFQEVPSTSWSPLMENLWGDEQALKFLYNCLLKGVKMGTVGRPADSNHRYPSWAKAVKEAYNGGDKAEIISANITGLKASWLATMNRLMDDEIEDMPAPAPASGSTSAEVIVTLQPEPEAEPEEEQVEEPPAPQGRKTTQASLLAALAKMQLQAE